MDLHPSQSLDNQTQKIRSSAEARPFARSLKDRKLLPQGEIRGQESGAVTEGSAEKIRIAVSGFIGVTGSRESRDSSPMVTRRRSA